MIFQVPFISPKSEVWKDMKVCLPDLSLSPSLCLSFSPPACLPFKDVEDSFSGRIQDTEVFNNQQLPFFVIPGYSGLFNVTAFLVCKTEIYAVGFHLSSLSLLIGLDTYSTAWLQMMFPD